MRTPMHQAAFPGEDISDRPEPETVAPRLVTLLTSGPPERTLSGGGVRRRRRRLAPLAEVSGVTVDRGGHARCSPGDRRRRFAPPRDLTAPEPPEYRGLRRDGVRLLVADARGVHHTRFDRLADHLRAGDVLVVNTSATVPGQLDGRRGADPVVVHVANRLPDGTRVVELRSAPRAAEPLLDGHAGEVIGLAAGGQVELLAEYPRAGSSPSGTGNRLWRGRVRVDGSLADVPVPARPADQLRLSRPVVPDRELPDDLRAASRQRRDAQRRSAVQPGARDPAGGPAGW